MSRHVLVLGGHGKIAQLLTPILLKKSWTVTSVIRAQDQVPTIEGLAVPGKGKLNVLVRSIEDVNSEAKARAILDEVKPDTVVFSAGAGGKGNPERTDLVDRDAASHFIRASVATPSIHKFILISYLASRRVQPSWWDASAWSDAQAVNEKLARYYQAKIVADEVLYEASSSRADFAGISLRPGTLTEEPAGRVEFGKTKAARGDTSRATVAEVTAALVEADGVKTSWLDLLDGTEEIGAAVDRVVREKIDVTEGEPVLEKAKKA